MAMPSVIHPKDQFYFLPAVSYRPSSAFKRAGELLSLVELMAKQCE
jgi:hypothetical protein